MWVVTMKMFSHAAPATINLLATLPLLKEVVVEALHIKESESD